MRRIHLLVALLFSAAACQPALRDGRVFNTDPDLIGWDRSPQAVIFRADITGGAADLRALNSVPNCTIYGDNRVVWVNELAPFKIEVLEDRLPNEAISAFVQYLTVYERVYTYEALSSEIQQQAGAHPVVETVELNVNDDQHSADSFGGWDTDWFPRVVEACKRLSETPVLIAPSSGWLAARSVEYNQQSPLSTWNAATMGVRLADLAPDAPRWINGDGATALWNMIHSLPLNLLFEEDGSYYMVALQVPGVTRDSPPAPES